MRKLIVIKIENSIGEIKEKYEKYLNDNKDNPKSIHFIHSLFQNAVYGAIGVDKKNNKRGI